MTVSRTNTAVPGAPRPLLGPLTPLLLLLALLVPGADGQNDSCYISQDLNLLPLYDVPAVTGDVLFSELNANGTAVEEVLAAENMTWGFSSCVPQAKFFSPSVNLTGCAQAGNVAVHSSTGACLDSYTRIAGPLEAGIPAARVIQTVYQSPATKQTVTVDVQCRGLQPSAADPVHMARLAASNAPTAVAQNRNDGAGGITAITQYDNVTLTYESRYACKLNDKLCDGSTVFCRNETDRCLGTPGVCTDTNCLQMSMLSPPSGDPRGVNVRKRLVVRDACRNIVVPGLTTDKFAVTVDGVPIINSQPEGAVLVSPNVGTSAQMLVTLALDQSASVVNTKTQLVKDSVAHFLDALFPDTSGSLSPPKVGVFTFDGSPDVIALQPSFSSDKAALKDAVNSQLPKYPGDLQSTNLFGAVERVAAITAASVKSMAYTVKDGSVDVREEPQKSLVIFSDGDDTADRFSRAESIRQAQSFRNSNNDTTIFYVDVSDSANTDYANEVTGDPSRVFKISAKDLVETFTNIGTTLRIDRAKYSVGLCTPFRSGVHAMSVTLNHTLLGVPPMQPLEWVFGTDDIATDCTLKTLQDAAAAEVQDAQVIASSLPVLSRLQLQVRTEDGYFLVDTTGMLDGFVNVVSSAGVRYPVMLSDGSPSCEVITKYCKAANGTARLAIPHTVFSDLTNPPRIMGLVLHPSYEAIGAPVDVQLAYTPIPATASPTPVPTAAPTPSPEDDDFDWLWVILVIVAVIVVCLIIFYFARQLNAKAKQDQEREEEEAAKSSAEASFYEGSQHGFVTVQEQPEPVYRAEAMHVGTRSAPVNFATEMRHFHHSGANPAGVSRGGSGSGGGGGGGGSPHHSDPQSPTGLSDVPYGADLMIGASSPNTMNGVRPYYPLQQM